MVVNMRKIFLASTFLLLLAASFSYAQTQASDDDIPERLKHFKEKYEASYEAPFEVVWSSVKETIASYGVTVAQQKNSQDDEGLYKGVLKSENIVFTEGKDSTYQTLQKYHYNMKYIPNGVWTNGRISYKIILKEVKSGTVTMIMTTEMSAFESHITTEYHYWKSNGIFEKEFLDRLNANVAKNNK